MAKVAGVVFASVFLVDFALSQSSWCDEEYECSDETVDNENVYCYGYGACMYSDVTSEENCYMYGELAAYEADVTSEYNLYCYGLKSCFDATLYVDNDFYCEGYAAAAYSNIEVNDDMISRGIYSLYNTEIEGEDYAYIYGYGTAMGAEIEDFNRFYNYGFLSMAYAEVYTGGDGKTFYMYNYGYYSSYGATLYCESEDTCYVYCDSTGCDGLTIYYASDSTLSVSCDDDCAECPTEEEYDDLDKMKQGVKYLQHQKKRNKFKEMMNQEMPKLEKKSKSQRMTKQKTTTKAADLLSHKRSKHLTRKIVTHLGLEMEPSSIKTHNEQKSFTLINDFHKQSSSSSFLLSIFMHVQWFSFAVGVIFTVVIAMFAIMIAAKCSNASSNKMSMI